MDNSIKKYTVSDNHFFALNFYSASPSAPTINHPSQQQQNSPTSLNKRKKKQKNSGGGTSTGSNTNTHTDNTNNALSVENEHDDLSSSSTSSPRLPSSLEQRKAIDKSIRTLLH